MDYKLEKWQIEHFNNIINNLSDTATQLKNLKLVQDKIPTIDNLERIIITKNDIIKDLNNKLEQYRIVLEDYKKNINLFKWFEIANSIINKTGYLLNKKTLELISLSNKNHDFLKHKFELKVSINNNNFAINDNSHLVFFGTKEKAIERKKEIINKILNKKDINKIPFHIYNEAKKLNIKIPDTIHINKMIELKENLNKIQTDINNLKNITKFPKKPIPPSINHIKEGKTPNYNE